MAIDVADIPKTILMMASLPRPGGPEIADAGDDRRAAVAWRQALRYRRGRGGKGGIMTNQRPSTPHSALRGAAPPQIPQPTPGPAPLGGRRARFDRSLALCCGETVEARSGLICTVGRERRGGLQGRGISQSCRPSQCRESWTFFGAPTTESPDYGTGWRMTLLTCGWSRWTPRARPGERQLKTIILFRWCIAGGAGSPASDPSPVLPWSLRPHMCKLRTPRHHGDAREA